MGNSASQKPNLYALLIGIDCYLPNQLPGCYYYVSLGGCVRDITHVEEFLRRTLGIAQERILKLTATDAGQGGQTEPEDQWPTCKNMVAKFKQLEAIAHSGDHVYIHYSGYGVTAAERGAAAVIACGRQGVHDCVP